MKNPPEKRVSPVGVTPEETLSHDQRRGITTARQAPAESGDTPKTRPSPGVRSRPRSMRC